jgi:hypothetical protein
MKSLLVLFFRKEHSWSDEAGRSAASVLGRLERFIH